MQQNRDTRARCFHFQSKSKVKKVMELSNMCIKYGRVRLYNGRRCCYTNALN